MHVVVETATRGVAADFKVSNVKGCNNSFVFNFLFSVMYERPKI
jgi:hypothetical protein